MKAYQGKELRIKVYLTTIAAAVALIAAAFLSGGPPALADDQQSELGCSGTMIANGGTGRICVPPTGQGNSEISYVDDNSSSDGNTQSFPVGPSPLPVLADGQDEESDPCAWNPAHHRHLEMASRPSVNLSRPPARVC